MLIRFINPEAAREVFDKQVVEKSESTDTFLYEQMAKDTGGKYTPEELQKMMDHPEDYRELDKIEKV